MNKVMRVNNPARQNASVSAFMSYILSAMAMEQNEAERLENERKIVNGSCTLLFGKRPSWCPHPSRISCTWIFEFLYPGHLECCSFGLQANHKHKCMPDGFPFNLISLW